MEYARVSLPTGITGVVFAGLIMAVLCGVCPGDVVVLKGGQQLTGDILAAKQAHLYVDVGFTVLAIPTEDVLEYEYDVNAAEVQAEGPSQRPAGRLYYTGHRAKKTIEQCVEDVSQAVVKVSSPAGMGSGFFINEQGELITNYHVIEKETRIEVTVFEKREDGFEKKSFKKVRLEAINPFVDLALLKVEGLGDTRVGFVYLGDIEKIQVGEAVFAIGNPLGLERTVTNGVISTTNRAFEGLVYIQTNADINPGNSGGPLFNLAGEVVGVTNMGYIFFGGLGFAIPVDYVKHFIDNRDAFAFDRDNPNTGYRYYQPNKRRNPAAAEFLKAKKKKQN